MFSSLVATIISAGYPREKLEFIRHYAVFNIVSCKLQYIRGYNSNDFIELEGQCVKLSHLGIAYSPAALKG